MSWCWNHEGKALSNLDHIKSLEVKEIEYDEENPYTEGDPTHVLVGIEADSMTEDGSTVWLKTGTEDECLRRLAEISKKIHVL